MARWLGPRWVADEAARRVTTAAARAVGGRWGARRSSLVVAQNHDAARQAQRLGARTVVVEPNVALERAPGAPPARPAGDRPPPEAGRAVFAGRLIRWKGAAVAVRALAQPPLRRWALDVYGEGEERRRLERLSARLGVGDRVRFHGQADRQEVLRAFAEADVLVLPSLNDSAGWVVAEAAAAGCPTVCLERGGPAELVAEGAGVAVAVGPRLVERVAAAMVASRRLAAPLDRWSTERMPALVDAWYQAVAAPPGPAPAPATSA
jgi:glycosyltransferase involved in cell wall biosynthesis